MCGDRLEPLGKRLRVGPTWYGTVDKHITGGLGWCDIYQYTGIYILTGEIGRTTVKGDLIRIE